MGSLFGRAAEDGRLFQLENPQRPRDVFAQGLRALASPVDTLIDGSGRPGIDGPHGQHGAPGKHGADGAPGKAGYGPGRPGKPGKDGKDGKPGAAGKKGKNGEKGTDGGKAWNVYVHLSGSNSNSVRVGGHMEYVVNSGPKVVDSQQEGSDASKSSSESVRQPLVLLRQNSKLPGSSRCTEVTDNNSAVLSLQQGKCISIRAHGGRGGRGGNGGHGGNGGRGGSGGAGGPGGDGKKGMKPGMNGENGGNGGNGGSGMPGGQGGDGGAAGKGGNAGSGGRVVVETTNPALLMLVEVDVRPGHSGKAGIPGKGGVGGESGRGGPGGSPGLGGPPWDELYLKRQHKTKKYFFCSSGHNGDEGKPGQAGSPAALRGLPGMPADAGKDGRTGQVTWIVRSASGKVVDKGQDRYNCIVTHFRVRSGLKDGVIAPGGKVLIDEVEVCNNGGMTLPAGARLCFKDTVMLFSSEEGQVDILPALQPNQIHRSNKLFQMDVLQVGSPTGGACFHATTAVLPLVDLLGRPFWASEDLLEIPVQYPIHFVADAELPHTIRKGDLVVVRVRLRNISTGVYGGRTKLSLGTVAVKILMFVELEGGQRQEYSWSQKSETIAPGQDAHMDIPCQISEDCRAFSLAAVQVHLLLNNRSIEYRHLESRVIPQYEKAKEVVFVTDPQLKAKEYTAWKCVLAILGLEHVCWDVTWHCSFAPSEISWLGSHELVIFPHVPQDYGLFHWIRRVLPWHVHRLGDSVENAAAIIMGPYPKDISHHMIDWGSLASSKVVTTARFTISCCGVSEDTAARRAATQALHFQDQLNTQNQLQYNFVVSPYMKRGSTSVNLRAYKEVLPAMFRVKSAPIESLAVPSGFLPAPPPDVRDDGTDEGFDFQRRSPSLGRDNEAKNDKPKHHWSPIPLWSPFGFALAAMLVYLPIKFKLKILAHFHACPPGELPLLFTPNISFIQVIGFGFYHDLKMDWFNRRDNLPHGVLLVSEIENLVNSGRWNGWSLTQEYVHALTGGLIHFRAELSSRLLSARASKAKTTVNFLIDRVYSAICRGEMKFPTEKQIKQVYDNLGVLPPWLFADVTEKAPIQIVYE